MDYQDFQRQIELASGLTDWMYYEGESDYFRSARNNGQFEVVYSVAEYRCNWTAKRRSDTMQIEKDCFTLKSAIDFLNMAIVINEPKQSDDPGFVDAIGFVLIELAIRIKPIATVPDAPNYIHSSVVERT